MAVPLRLTQLTFTPQNFCLRYFFGLFGLGCLEILLLSMPESLEAIAVKKKSQNATLKFFDFI
jgi:hypothetical protein